jgi:hypothetical protein
VTLEEMHHERERAFCEAFNIPFPYIPPEKRFSPDVEAGKILVLPDPHEPYGAQFVFDDALENHWNSEMVIVPGDLGDYYSKSRFRKTRPGNFRAEVMSVFLRLEWLSTHWRTVKVMLGNHDNRPEKKIQDILNVDTELLILTELNLLQHLACYFPNIEVVGHRIKSTGIGLTYLWQFGDMIFTHAEISRAQESATMEYVSNWLHTWRHMIDLKPYTFIGQAHNHGQYNGGRDGEKWLMFPTASDPYSVGMEYVYQGRMYKKPPVVGYSLVYHDNGSCRHNECRNIVLRAG